MLNIIYYVYSIFYITQTASHGTHMCPPMPVVYIHLPAAKHICGGGAKSAAAAAIAVFTHVMRGLQSTSLASVAQNVVIYRVLQGFRYTFYTTTDSY